MMHEKELSCIKKLFIFKIYFSSFFLPENVMKIKYKELLMLLSTKAIIRSFCTHKIIFFLLQKFLNIDFIDETNIQWSKTEWCIGSMNGIFSSFSEIIFFVRLKISKMWMMRKMWMDDRKLPRLYQEIVLLFCFIEHFNNGLLKLVLLIVGREILIFSSDVWLMSS